MTFLLWRNERYDATTIGVGRRDFYVRAETARWTKVVRAATIPAQ
ncbi:MAG: hypothetical protein ACXW2A_14440 [Burkholderiales bacterium]